MIKNALKEILGDIDIDVEIVDEIPKQPTKKKAFVSNIK